MKKISISTFYNHKQVYVSTDFLNITNLTKTTYDNTINFY